MRGSFSFWEQVMILTPVTNSSVNHAVGASAANMGAAMAAGQFWTLVSNVALWIKQGSDAALTATPASVGGAGCMLWPANFPLVFRGDDGADLSIIADSTTGKASITRNINF
jgi:hypothetical protein